MHHPWRIFRTLTDWTLHWAPLPDGIWAETDFGAKTVTMRPGLTQAERRCSIAHETFHIQRGPFHPAVIEREEAVIDRNTARLLIPDIKALGDALAWAVNLREAADELWVDDDTLETRLEHLHPSERAYLQRRLREP